MDSFSLIIAIVVIALIFWLLTSRPNMKVYHCQKCGFETTSQLEAVGHEKLENSHKLV